MKIAIGSDEKNHLTDFVIERLQEMGLELDMHGPLKNDSIQWTDVAKEVAEKVSSNQCDQGILFCWSGTGVSIAANKVPGVRAALCTDAETASSARKWNDANVLAMSLRTTSPTVAEEMINAWLSSSPEEEEKENIRKISEIEKKYSR